VVHLTLTAASRRCDTRSLQSLNEIVLSSPNYTNQYTNPPKTSVNDDKRGIRRIGLNKRIVEQ
jgi:hypothetical protein